MLTETETTMAKPPENALRSVLVGVALLGLVVGLVRLSGALRTTPGTVLVGDSITALLLVDGAPPAIDPDGVEVVAVPGRTAQQMRATVDELADKRPERVVVNLGTNDLLSGRSAAETNDDLAWIIRRFSRGTCVVVVTLNERMVHPDRPQLAADAAAVNRQLRWTAADASAGVVDWAALVGVHDHAGDSLFPMTLDTVHPSISGRSALIEAYQRALSQACPE